MPNLFVYGSLQFPELVEKLTGEEFNSSPAILKGFQRFAVKRDDYPAIIENLDSEVHGLLLFDIDERSMEILTFYEGDEYARASVAVTCESGTYDALVFVWSQGIQLLEDFDWDINLFRENSLQIYLDKVAPETKRDFRNSDI